MQKISETIRKEMKDITIPSKIVEIWQRIVDSMAVVLSVPSVMINRLEPPDIEVFCSNISSENPLPAGTRIPMLGVYCSVVAQRRQKLQVEDARKDRVWADSPTAKAGIYAYIGYPVFWPDGELFGTVCAVDMKEHKWAGASEVMIRTIKDAIEAHLAILAVTDELNKKNQELEKALGEVKALQELLPECASCERKSLMTRDIGT